MPRPPAVARVLERVTATSRSHQMFHPGELVLVACSGGPDSMCLLHSMNLLRRLLRIKVGVFHFDHRLRPDSGKDATYVKRAATGLRLPLHLVEADSRPRRGQSVEDWAHQARLAAMGSALRESGAARMAIGHTLDDQAETVLIALIRGGGPDAVAGIRPAMGPFVQPLIDVSREEVEAFLRALRLRPRRDPTNRDTRMLRNAVRLKGIPGLQRAVGREIAGPFARSAALLRADAEFVREAAAEHVEELVEDTRDGVTLSARDLSGMPRALGSRVAGQAMLRCGVLATAEAVEGVLDLAAGRAGRKRDLPGGLKAVRDREYVRLSRSSPEGAG